MVEHLRFDNQVVIVTGAGAGLGRSHALLFGMRGAKVVVNDLGGGAHGGGASQSAADKVVEEIKAAGGIAVANYDSVEQGDKIVKTALDAFGTVDIVVNNAGILRDVSFQKMTDEDWNLILRVHLNGTRSVTQAAWPILRDKKYGRVIMTTSGAGIYGNFGQANYCAAKLGIFGLAQCLAEEGRAKNIHVNTIAPIAASRLTATVMPEDVLKSLEPEAVSALVGWLCHESCTETKSLFEVGAGYFSKLRWERTRGHTFKRGHKFGMDDVAAQWGKITDFTDAEHPVAVVETFTAITKAINSVSRGGNEFIDLDVAFSGETVVESSYDERDLSLYALGVGAAKDPTDAKELALVHERDDKFCPLPTYAVMPPTGAMLSLAKEGKALLPGLNYGFDRLLHGEQYTEVRRPLPRSAKLKHSFKLKAAYDKNPHAVVVTAVTSTDESGEEVMYNELTSFVRGAGGWGGERGPSTEINLPPSREPDVTIEEKTDVNQTLLYRLSGDWNPLHVDPAFAKAFGYDRPILHGLCTFGIVGRHVIKSFCDNDPRKFKSIKVRFADVVFPGETLVTRMWKEPASRIVLEVRIKERDKLAIKNAAVELYEQIPLPKAKTAAQPTTQAMAAAQSTELVAADLFGGLARHIAKNPDLVSQVKTTFQFTLSDPAEDWALDLKNGKGSCLPGKLDKPDVTLGVSGTDLVGMFTGTADAQKLYFGGKLKVTGNVMASQKLGLLQKTDPKLYEEARAERLKTGPATAAAPAPTASVAAAPPKAGRGDEIFRTLGKKLGGKPGNGLAGKVLLFQLREPSAQWTVDFSSAKPAVTQGASARPSVTFGLDDEDLVHLAHGADARDLFQRGKLRVDGDVRLAHELSTLLGNLGLTDTGRSL